MRRQRTALWMWGMAVAAVWAATGLSVYRPPETVPDIPDLRLPDSYVIQLLAEEDAGRLLTASQRNPFARFDDNSALSEAAGDEEAFGLVPESPDYSAEVVGVSGGPPWLALLSMGGRSVLVGIGDTLFDGVVSQVTADSVTVVSGHRSRIYYFGRGARP